MFDIKDGADLDNRLAIIEGQLEGYIAQYWNRAYEIRHAITTLKKEDLTNSWKFLTVRDKSDMLNRYQAILQLALTLNGEHGASYTMLQKQIIHNHPRLLMDLLISGGDVNAMGCPPFSCSDTEGKMSLLGMAGYNGNLEAVGVLIRYHADLNIRSYYNKLEIVKNGQLSTSSIHIHGPCIAREIAFQMQKEFPRNSKDFDTFDKIIKLLDQEARSRLQREFWYEHLKNSDDSGVDISSYYAYLSALNEDGMIAREYYIFYKNDNAGMHKAKEDALNLYSSGTYDFAQQNCIRTEIEKIIERNKQSLMCDGANPEKWPPFFLKRLLELRVSPMEQNDAGQTILHKILEKITKSPAEARAAMIKIRLFLDYYDDNLGELNKFLTIKDSNGNSPASLIRNSGNATLIEAFKKELLERNIEIDSVQTTPAVKFSLSATTASISPSAHFHSASESLPASSVSSPFLLSQPPKDEPNALSGNKPANN